MVSILTYKNMIFLTIIWMNVATIATITTPHIKQPILVNNIMQPIRGVIHKPLFPFNSIAE